jgi:hypothetical protein
MDFLLRDVFHDAVSVTPDSARTWAVLRARIAAERPAARRPRLICATLNYLGPLEWSLDWHLVSLGRTVR